MLVSARAAVEGISEEEKASLDEITQVLYSTEVSLVYPSCPLRTTGYTV